MDEKLAEAMVAEHAKAAKGRSSIGVAAQLGLGETERVISMQAIAAEHGHALLVLTNHGRMFQRYRDPRATNWAPGQDRDRFIWKQLVGPLDSE